MVDSTENYPHDQEEEPKVYAVKRGNGEINFTRRDFLKAASVATAATLAGCSSGNAEVDLPDETPTRRSTNTPAPTATSTPTETPAPTDTPQPTDTPSPTATEMDQALTGDEVTQICSTAKAHEENVWQLVFSPDGQLLVSTDSDVVKIWSLPELALIKTIEIDSPRVTFSPDGKYLILGGSDGQVEMWSTVGWNWVESRTHHSEPVYELAFAKDGKQMISLDKEGGIVIWNLPDLSVFHSVDTQGETQSRLFISPDETILVTTAYESGSLHLWSFPELELLQTIETGAESVYSIEFSADSKTMLTPGEEGYFLEWSLPDGEKIGSYEVALGDRVGLLTLTPDGKKLIIRSGGFTQVMSYPGLDFIDAFPGSGPDIIENGNLLVNSRGDLDMEVQIRLLSDLDYIGGFNVGQDEIFSTVLSPKENILAIGYYLLGVIEIYSIPSGKQLACLMDLVVSPPEVEGIEIDIEVEGEVVTYTLPCGSPIPPGAVCTCNCVGGYAVPPCSCVGYVACSCVGHVCSCVGHVSGGSHYWHPN